VCGRFAYAADRAGRVTLGFPGNVLLEPELEPELEVEPELELELDPDPDPELEPELELPDPDCAPELLEELLELAPELEPELEDPELELEACEAGIGFSVQADANRTNAARRKGADKLNRKTVLPGSCLERMNDKLLSSAGGGHPP
jgi:hypothetical protein